MSSIKSIALTIDLTEASEYERDLITQLIWAPVQAKTETAVVVEPQEEKPRARRKSSTKATKKTQSDGEKVSEAPETPATPEAPAPPAPPEPPAPPAENDVSFEEVMRLYVMCVQNSDPRVPTDSKLLQAELNKLGIDVPLSQLGSEEHAEDRRKVAAWLDQK